MQFLCHLPLSTRHPYIDFISIKAGRDLVRTSGPTLLATEYILATEATGVGTHLRPMGHSSSAAVLSEFSFDVIVSNWLPSLLGCLALSLNQQDADFHTSKWAVTFLLRYLANPCLPSLGNPC